MKKILILLALAFWCHDLWAHARWSSDGPTPGRNNQANLKQGPCGGVRRTNTPAVFQAGSTVTLEWESTIYHRGYFIISFSPEGDRDFEQHVLIENIPERMTGGPGKYSAQVTLPSEPCENCTLQMIQVMLDRNPPTNYYSCADIQLVTTTNPGDTTPPAAIDNLAAKGGAPSLTLNWQNPTEDFAGVLVTRGSQDIPQMGIGYLVGDAINNATVVSAGAAQEVMVTDAKVGEWFGVFALDHARNYSEGVFHQVTTVSNHAPQITLAMEQIGFADSDVYAADGPVIIQAAINDDDSHNTHQLEWSANEGLIYTTEDTQLHFSPSVQNLNEFSVAITVTDDGEPPYSATTTNDITIQPYSRHIPQLVLYQQGAAVTRVDIDNGPAELRLEFTNATPEDISAWHVEWSHSLVGATEEARSLGFELEAIGEFEIQAEVYSATALAAAPISVTVSAYKPIRLGVINTFWLMALLILLGFRYAHNQKKSA